MKKTPWRTGEDAHLATAYPTGTPIHALSAATGRTEAAIRRRAQKLKLRRRRPWSTWESRLVHSGYRYGVPVAVLAGALKRPPSHIVAHARARKWRHAAARIRSVA